MQFTNINGKIYQAGQASIRVDNHSYRYGHGLFETMKVADGRILLSARHFERLFHGFSVLKFQIPEIFTRQNLETQILDLCKSNNCEKLGRIRLSVAPGNGGLYDDDGKFQYVIESWPIGVTVDLNEDGHLPDLQALVIDIYPDARKSCDGFSNLKSANYLPYVMAGRFAKENNLNDCLILNSHDRICDSTNANIFWIKEENVFTPPLSEGCVSGVMRGNLIEKLHSSTHHLREKNCEISDLEYADEVFLTNVIQGIRWVKQFRNKTYTNIIVRKLYSEFILPEK